MVRARYAAFVAVLLLASPLRGQAASQAGAQTESLTDLLLRQAQTALDAFDRPNAQKFALQILEQMTTSSAAQKEKARIILANVYYPEEAPNERKRAEALAVLKVAVRENFDLTIDRTLSWAGLDSILTEAKATTYGLATTANPQQEVVGPGGRAEVSVRASRPSNFRLTVRSLNGQATVDVADTSGATEAKLQFPAMRDDRPLFPAGDYEMILTATDRVSGDTISSRFTATVTAAPLTFATVPSAIDTAQFLPERTRKYGWKGVVVGALVSGSIYGFSSVLHADPALQTSAGADSKGMGVAALAGISVIAASFMDRGRQIPSAIAANQKTRDDFATSIRTAQAENANRIANYRTVFAITPGAR